MKLSAKLNKELNTEFDPMQHILRKNIYGSKKRALALKQQSKAAKLIKQL